MSLEDCVTTNCPWAGRARHQLCCPSRCLASAWEGHNRECRKRRKEFAARLAEIEAAEKAEAEAAGRGRHEPSGGV